MSYKLIFSKDALKSVRKLDTITKKRLGKKLKEYTKDPLRYAKKLTDSKIGSYRWRIGNYRIVFDLKRNKIQILQIGHRKEIYRK